MSFDVLIFGCGNIGSRHLQGLLKANKVRLFVVENNKNLLRHLKREFLNLKTKSSQFL